MRSGHIILYVSMGFPPSSMSSSPISISIFVPRAHDDCFFMAEEEECVTGKNLKQAKSLACTKNRTRELNTLDITPGRHVG